MPTNPKPKPITTIHQAILNAQQECESLPRHDSSPDGSYHYVGAERMIETGRVALHNNNLLMLRLSASVALEGTLPVLTSTFLLVHTPSKEELSITVSLPLRHSVDWPIDKAAMAAATSSLSYAIRDLLLLPRVSVEVDSVPVSGIESVVPPDITSQLSPEDAELLARSFTTGSKLQQAST